jgi:aspartyl protease family protein
MDKLRCFGGAIQIMRKNPAILIAAICAASMFRTTAYAADVNVVGLADNAAILVIDGGKPRLLRVGQTREGVRLISVRGDHAIVEIDGEQQELPLRDNSYAPPRKGARSSVVLAPNSQGHYLILGTINGASVHFLVDTGASMVSMDASHALSAGIDYLSGQKGVASTANGLATVYRVKLDTVQVGDITLTNIDGIVHADARLPFVLLGMSFLTQLNMRRDNDNLMLERRF